MPTICPECEEPLTTGERLKKFGRRKICKMCLEYILANNGSRTTADDYKDAEDDK
jgi:hypothetical protein